MLQMPVPERSERVSLQHPKLVASAASNPAISPAAATPVGDLFGLRQLEVAFEQETGTIWTFMRPHGRPSYNPPMLRDFDAWQDGIEHRFRGEPGTLRYLVLGSRFPKVFCLGGDLDHFIDRIRCRDRAALVSYGRACINILYRNMLGLGLPIVTIGLVQGDALGGGFESLLSFNVIVAEKGARFGLPETVFGLFPGMGAHAFLVRRLGAAEAERMIVGGGIYTAEDMYQRGIVHVLAEPGEGIEAVRDYIAQNGRRQRGHRAIYEASRAVMPITLAELESIVEIWADAALDLREHDLKVMRRLVAAQDRLLGVAAPAAAE
jgi:DSF synthase